MIFLLVVAHQFICHPEGFKYSVKELSLKLTDYLEKYHLSTENDRLEESTEAL